VCTGCTPSRARTPTSAASIPARAMVYLVYISAGHDEQHFPDPRAFDVRRENAEKHLSLGRGRPGDDGAPARVAAGRMGPAGLRRR
jgi:hypothetical protein